MQSSLKIESGFKNAITTVLYVPLFDTYTEFEDWVARHRERVFLVPIDPSPGTEVTTRDPGSCYFGNKACFRHHTKNCNKCGKTWLPRIWVLQPCDSEDEACPEAPDLVLNYLVHLCEEELDSIEPSQKILKHILDILAPRIVCTHSVKSCSCSLVPLVLVPHDGVSFSTLFRIFSTVLKCSGSIMSRHLLVPRNPSVRVFLESLLLSSMPLHLRWAALRSIFSCCSCPNHDEYHAYVDAIQEEITTSYPELVVPESLAGVVSSALTGCTSKLEAFFHFLKDSASETCEILSTFLGAIMRRVVMVGLMKAFGDFRSLVKDSLIELTEKFGDLKDHIIDFMERDLFISVLKATMRWAMGYTPACILVEMLWDLGSHITALMGTLVRSFFVEDYATPEAEDPNQLFIVISALLIGVMTSVCKSFSTVNAGHITSLLRNVHDAASLLDRVKVSQAISALKSYVTGVTLEDEERIRFAQCYPKTMEFHATHVAFLGVDNPTVSHKRNLKHAFAEYLNERKKWKATDSQRLHSFVQTASLAAIALGATAEYAYRMEPPFFLFSGPPGTMKSAMCQAMAAAISKTENGLDSKVADYVYNVCPVDRYSSGYCWQGIWVFDEFLQTHDDAKQPAGDVEIMFRLCTPGPLSLNMAGVDDKGKIGRCNLILGATNVDLTSEAPIKSLRQHIKSIKDVGAFRRRLTHVVIPHVKEPYTYDADVGRILLNGVPLTPGVMVDRSRIFSFTVRGIDEKSLISPMGSTDWTWEELLRLAYDCHNKVRDFDPDASPDGDRDLDILKPRVSVEPEAFDSWGDIALIATAATATAVAGGFFGKNLVTQPDVVPHRMTCCRNRSHFTTNVPCLLGEEEAWRKNGLDYPYGKPYSVTDPCIDPTGARVLDPIAVGWEESMPNRVLFNATGWVGNVALRFSKVEDVPIVAPGERAVHQENLNKMYDICLRCGDSNFSTTLTFDMPLKFQGGCVLPPGVYIVGFVTLVPRDLFPHRYYVREQPKTPLIALYMAPFIGLLLGGGVGVGLAWAALKARDKAVIFLQGVAHYYDPKKDAFVPEAVVGVQDRIYVGGKWYLKKTKQGGGFEWYEESKPEAAPMASQLIETMTYSERFSSQLPTIQESLFAIVDSTDSTLIGNAFAINSTCLLMPNHVATYVEHRPGVVLRRGREVYPLYPNTAEEKGLSVTNIGPDLAIVECYISKVPSRLERCRNHASKFNDEPVQWGMCRLMIRNAEGEIEYSEGSFHKTTGAGVGYEYQNRQYSVPPSRIRLADVPSRKGFCGGIYVNIAPNAERTLLGVHIARTADTVSAIIHIVKSLDLEIFKRTSLPVSNVTLRGVPESAMLLQSNSLHSFGKTDHYVPYQPPPRKKRTWLYPIIQPAYDLAHLRPFKNLLGEVVDPMSNALKKLGDVSSETRPFPVGMMKAVYAFVRYCKVYGLSLTKPGSWESTVNSERGLPSMKRKKSAGYPYRFWGGLKGLSCEAIEEVVLKEAFRKFLIAAELILVPDDWVTRDPDNFSNLDAVSAATMKDEPKSKDKVDEGKTRLFTVVPLHEFLLERRYFMDFASEITEKGLLFFSALGMDPENGFEALYDQMAEKGEGAQVLTADFTFMDGHVDPRMIRLITAFFSLIYPSDGQTRTVDPLLPPLDRDGFMRYRLLRRIAWCVLLVKDAYVEPGRMHPSGSFLTSIINYLVQVLLWSAAFAHVLEIDPYLVLDEFFMQFLGDDSLIVIPKKYAHVDLELVRLFIKSQGFLITGDVKAQDIQLRPVWDKRSPLPSSYMFLRRRFGCTRDGRVVGLLEPDSIEKILCFTESSDAVGSFMQQMLTTAQHLKLHSECDYPESTRVVSKMARVYDSFKKDLLSDLLRELSKANPDCESLLKPAHLVVTRQFQDGSFLFAIPEGKEDNQTTTFEGSEVSPQVAPTVSSEGWHDAGMERTNHAVSNVFMRPYIVGDIAYTTSSVGALFDADFPKTFFDNNFNAQAKLANFAFLRCKLHIKVSMTASPYSAGKLILSVRPLSRPCSDVYEAVGDPCVELDVASATSGELVVDQVSPSGWSPVEALNLSDSYFNWCTVQLWALTPLREDPAIGVHIKVWAWLSDVELKGPTLTQFVLSPQVGDDEKKETSFVPNKLFTPGESEANFLTNAIERQVSPTVKSIGGLIVDVANIAITGAKIAALLSGFSKPAMNTSNVGYVLSYNNITAPNLMGNQPAVILAASPNQKAIQVEGTFGKSGDEMDIPTFTSRMGVARIYTWTAAMVTHTAIGQFRVTPGNFMGANNTAHCSPVCFVSTLFRFWRGSLKWRLALAKTQFHAGVIEIVWQMGLGQYGIVDDAESSLCQRYVWDIQEESEFCFVTPYVSMTPWTPCVFENATITSFSVSEALSTGFLSIRVVNPLISAAALVTDSVDIVVYCGAGPDIEFAVPMSMFANSSFGPPTSEDKGKEPEIPCVPEAGGVFQRSSQKGDFHEFIEAVPHTPVTALNCIGESIPNLRLLTRRFSSRYTLAMTTASHAEIPFHRILYNDLTMYLVSVFAFFSGGYRVQVSNSTTVYAALNAKQAMSFALKWCGHVLYAGPEWNILGQDRDFVLQVPYHNIVPFLPTSYLNPSSTRKPTTSLGISYVGSVTAYVTYATSAADDFTLGWQIGVPEMDLSENVAASILPVFSC